MSFSTQKLHFSIKIPIQNYKQPSQTFTNDRTKSPQTTEKSKKVWTISGLECDTVLHRRNGTYGLIEVKLGGEKLINDGADALNTLANTIDTTKMKKPSFKMVLTAVGPYAYQRPDGIFVVPIGCLKD
ncbi:hypothetical protein J4031_13155 [Xylanibacter ruminicola]|nr:hypothetical protein J4031_13155 [Xylanibacter ruminicola]